MGNNVTTSTSFVGNGSPLGLNNAKPDVSSSSYHHLLQSMQGRCNKYGILECFKGHISLWKRRYILRIEKTNHVICTPQDPLSMAWHGMYVLWERSKVAVFNFSATTSHFLPYYPKMSLFKEANSPYNQDMSIRTTILPSLFSFLSPLNKSMTDLDS